MSMSESRELTYDECLALLQGGVVGRVAMCTRTGPLVLPVNYAVIGESVVFRTTPYGVLAGARDDLLAFETDHLDYENQRGWSVLATGTARAVDDEEELTEIRAAWDPRPWAGGQRRLYLRLEWSALSGRRTGSGWTRENEMPYRRSV
jgi:uncharacterized protein